MNFEKKLIILSGSCGRGTALLERNGMGNFITLNTFSLPDLTAGEYALGVKTAAKVWRRELGSLGRIKSRFALPDGEYGAVHLVLFRTADDEVVLYGTSAERKLWESNLMDGFRRVEIEKKTADAGKALAATQEFTYSERKIEDYFLDILPQEYSDGALAEENYFEFSPRPSSARESYYEEQPPMPSDMQRNYLNKRFANKQYSDTDNGGGYYSVLSGAAKPQGGSAEPRVPVGETRYKPLKEDAPEIKVKSASSYTVEEAVAAVKTEAGFYASVKPQLDKLFETGERYSPLETALPGTRWVKVDYDSSGRYYTVGLIGAAPDYIAYGVPGRFGDSPAALDGADFVPLNAAEPTGEGFWVLFQSAETGKEIVRRQ